MLQEAIDTDKEVDEITMSTFDRGKRRSQRGPCFRKKEGFFVDEVVNRKKFGRRRRQFHHIGRWTKRELREERRKVRVLIQREINGDSTASSKRRKRRFRCVCLFTKKNKTHLVT